VCGRAPPLEKREGAPCNMTTRDVEEAHAPRPTKFFRPH
jgi:hypothetical protein